MKLKFTVLESVIEAWVIGALLSKIAFLQVKCLCVSEQERKHQSRRRREGQIRSVITWDAAEMLHTKSVGILE